MSCTLVSRSIRRREKTSTPSITAKVATSASAPITMPDVESSVRRGWMRRLSMPIRTDCQKIVARMEAGRRVLSHTEPRPPAFLSTSYGTEGRNRIHRSRWTTTRGAKPTRNPISALPSYLRRTSRGRSHEGATRIPMMHWKSWMLVIALAPIASHQEPLAQAEEPAVEVLVRTFAFRPDTLGVPSGTTVTWTNGDEIEHTVTSDSASRGVAGEPLRGSLGG